MKSSCFKLISIFILFLLLSSFASCGKTINNNSPVSTSDTLDSLKAEENIDYYSLGREYELNYDFDNAIDCYEKVPQLDANYSDAHTKLSKLKREARINKFIAKAMVALKNQNFISSVSDVKQIGYGELKDYGLTVTCRINGYGYAISEQEIHSSLNDTGLGTYVSIYNNKLTDLFISEYISVYKENGSYTTLTNQIMQDGSDAEYKMVELFTKKDYVIINLVSHYVDLYDIEKDLSIFG